MKKSHCRMTAFEHKQHEQAIKVRRMTDKQIDMTLNETYRRGFEDGRKSASEAATPAAGE